jgi:hypothetical protein
MLVIMMHNGSNYRLVRFCLGVKIDENDALACIGDGLESCKV